MNKNKIKKDRQMSNVKKVNKRAESAKEYLDALQERYSKLCIVRVDLGYKKDEKSKKVEVSLDEAINDYNHMMNNKRSKPSIFKDQVGQICLKEYTSKKGVHFHAAFMYDGNKVHKGAFKAQQICDYWEEVTENKGSGHNCHSNQYIKNGLGILDHKDTEKRKIVDENVINYLFKDDDKQSISAIESDKKIKVFTRGTLPKSKDNKGRPRKDLIKNKTKE